MTAQGLLVLRMNRAEGLVKNRTWEPGVVRVHYWYYFVPHFKGNLYLYYKYNYSYIDKEEAESSWGYYQNFVTKSRDLIH